MAVPLPAYRSTPPTPIRAIGSLLIAPNGIARRMLNVCRNGFEDIGGCMSESRPIDLQRDDEIDAALLCLDRRDWLGARAHLVNAKALDAQVDPLVWGHAWTTAKRLAGCLERAFCARKRVR